MIEWYYGILLAVCLTVGVVLTVAGLFGVRPNDLVLAALALVELLLVGQVVIAIIAPLVGNVSVGSVLEFWIYLITAALIPPLAAFWALIERTRWATVVLGVAGLALAVMSYRMFQIWTVPLV
ncbi:MAG: hypothetical protein ACSLE3_00125 [Microbacteriaceae bacterium]